MGRSRVRSKSIQNRMTRAERAAWRAIAPTAGTRPGTRGECVGAPRPCPWVSCRHHLYLDVNPETGSLKLNFPHLEVWDLRETCSLDVADRGGATLEEVGDILNLTRERVRQVEMLARLAMAPVVGGDDRPRTHNYEEDPMPPNDTPARPAPVPAPADDRQPRTLADAVHSFDTARAELRDAEAELARAQARVESERRAFEAARAEVVAILGIQVAGAPPVQAVAKTRGDGPTSDADRIVAYVARRGTVSTTETAGYLGKSPTAVSQVLCRLVKARKLRRAARGKYAAVGSP